MSLPVGWERKKLSDFILLQRGFDLPNKKRRPGNYKVISAGDVHGWHNEYRVSGPGFTIGRVTNIGRPTWSEEDFWPLNTTLYAKDLFGNDVKFAYYWFLGTDLSGYNSGSVQPTLNRNYIVNVPIDVPPVIEQQAIAATLGALDDKIESNRRARKVSRELGMAIVGKEISELPETALENLVLSISRGVTPKYTKTVNDDSVSVLNQRCIRDGWVSLENSRTMLTRKKTAPEKIADPGDILVNSTGQGTLGRVGRWSGGTPIHVDSHVTVVKPNTERVLPTVFAYLMFPQQTAIEAMAVGSTGQTELSRENLLNLCLPEIPREIQYRLESVLDQLEEQVERLAQENLTLESLRDALLPELMSGRICVPEAQEAIAEVIPEEDDEHASKTSRG